jgi:N-acetylmuramic acid 6-phosphate etherase
MQGTESSSRYNALESMSIGEVLRGMNTEDQSVPLAIAQAMPSIELLIGALTSKMKAGGRLFYIGAGTSGRLGVVDASECPPTFGVPHDMVIGIIAGGDKAIRKAVEFAEDDAEQAWKDMQAYNICDKDFVVGIAASGRTPYVIGGLNKCREHNILTGCIACNIDSLLAKACDFPIEINTGPEFLTGSTRLKAGTAQKLVLNMITTTVMIQLGKVKGNKMVDMQLSNHKLVNRAVAMVLDEINVTEAEAKALLEAHGSVRKAVEWHIANAGH